MNFFQFYKVKSLLVTGTILLGAAACSNYDDEIADLGGRVTEVEKSIVDLQSQIDAGGLVSKVEKTANGFDIYFTGGNTDKISLTNGADGADGADGKDGINGTNGADGADGEDGKDGINGTNGADGEDGKDGINGTNGADGEDGKDGINGTNGEDGKDGVDGEDGKDGINGTDGKDGKDGKDGIDGKDVTSSSITYRNEGDYALFFFDAVGEQSARVIYAPMDVETPSSVTLLTSTLKDLTVGGTKSFDVVVNPTANAKAIKEFCLVSEAAYTRSESVYGEAPKGLEVVESKLNATIPGRYTITVKCTDINALANAIFVAAKYDVNAFDASIGLDGSVSADTYKAFKADKSEYNVSKEYELLSSTPITGSAVYESLVDADITVEDVVIYPKGSESFDILASADKVINVNAVTTSVWINSAYGADTDITVEYKDGKLTTTSNLESNEVSRMTYYFVNLEVSDFNGNNIYKSFMVYVYPNEDINATAAPANAWLPAVNDYTTTANADFTGLLNDLFDYDFDPAKTTIEATFADSYGIADLGVDVEDVNANAAEYVSVKYTDIADVEYGLTAIDEAHPVQPGEYTISIVGTATPKEGDLEPVKATLNIVVTVVTPGYEIALSSDGANHLAADMSAYIATEWADIAVSEGIIDPASTTQAADAPYLYQFDSKTNPSSIITDDAVRAVVGTVHSNEVVFPDPAVLPFETTVSFYYQLTTGVKFPVNVVLASATTPGNEIRVSKLPVKYDAIALLSVNATYNQISYEAATKPVIAKYAPASREFMAMQPSMGTISYISAYNPVMDGSSTYSALLTYEYELEGSLKYMENATAAYEDVPVGSPFKNMVAVDAKTGEVSIVAENLNWKASPDAIYAQMIKVTVTDFFGQSVSQNVIVTVVK